MLGAAPALAEPGYVTANVNLRTGPDTDFPRVAVIPEGEPVDIRGCLRDESWCDVRWGPDRGWVYSEYIAFDYRGETVPLPDLGLAAFSIPVVAFVASQYWDRYYVGRPWYRDRARWYKFKPRPRHGWHAPPAGPRKGGWWRSGYVAPKGMRPPPDRGWKRPARVERRDDRRDGHRKDKRDDRRDRRDDKRDDRRGGDRHDGHRDRR